MSIELCQSSTSASLMWAKDAALGRFADERAVGRVQQHDHRAGGFADDLVDQRERVLRAFPESDQRDVGSLPRGDRADVRDVDLFGDHLVPQRDDDRSDQRETVRALVSDQDPQMLGLAIMRGPAHAQIVSNPDAVRRSGPGHRQAGRVSLAGLLRSGRPTQNREEPRMLTPAGWWIGENATIGVLDTVTIGSLRLERFEAVLAPERYEAVRVAAERARELLGGRVVWNVNSTARGGGVAEMLISLLAYARGAGVDARWVVIAGDAPFFAVTKRIHNNLHSAPGDGGELGAGERELYEQALGPSVVEFAELVDRRDVVIVHDPQPAGLIPRLKTLGVTVIS